MRTLSSVVGVLFALGFTTSVSRAAEKVAPENLPAKVADAVKARFPGGQIEKAGEETEEGRVVYDIELRFDGRKYESDILEDGTIIEVEKEVAVKDLPAAVTKAILEKYPKATLKEAMEKSLVKDKAETPHEFEVVLETAEKKSLELTVSLDGARIEEEKDE